MALFSIGSAVGSAVGKGISQFNYANDEDTLQKLSEQKQREALAKRQKIGDVQESWAVEDINKSATARKGNIVQSASRSGLIDSGILHKDLRLLAENLSTTLNRRATSRTMQKGYESWSLDTELDLKRKEDELKKKYGSEQAGYGILGDIGKIGGDIYSYNQKKIC